MITLKPKYNIGDHVYHVLPESPPGIVTDINYRLSIGRILYEVSFDPQMAAMQYEEFELTQERILV